MNSVDGKVRADKANADKAKPGKVLHQLVVTFLCDDMVRIQHKHVREHLDTNQSCLGYTRDPYVGVCFPPTTTTSSLHHLLYYLWSHYSWNTNICPFISHSASSKKVNINMWKVTCPIYRNVYLIDNLALLIEYKSWCVPNYPECQCILRVCRNLKWWFFSTD